MAAMETSPTLKPGQAVRIRNPPAGDTFAKFRDRDGVIEYELPGEDDGWVVAVLRRKNERASGHVVRTPENDFEFIPVPGKDCLLYTSPSPRDATLSRMPSSA